MRLSCAFAHAVFDAWATAKPPLPTLLARREVSSETGRRVTRRIEGSDLALAESRRLQPAGLFFPGDPMTELKEASLMPSSP
jgi:hypothetical protein